MLRTKFQLDSLPYFDNDAFYLLKHFHLKDALDIAVGFIAGLFVYTGMVKSSLFYLFYPLSSLLTLLSGKKL